MRTKRSIALGVAVTLLLALAAPAVADAPPNPFFNGFENPGDVDGGDNFTGVTRVPSGTDGVTSAGGGWHATAVAGYFGNPELTFTRFGGYGTTFPANGFSTSIDVYLSDSPMASDLRADWSSSINKPDGTHRRDFIFSFGTDGSGGFAVTASNNAPGWPKNPGRDPLFFSGPGWFTLQHDFYDAGGGVLAADMSVLDSTGTVLKSWTLSDPSDIIGSTVGGSRYGWLVTNDFADLPLDNVVRTGLNLMERKQAVRDDLAALLPTGDDKDDKDIAKAIESLDDSLDPAYWADGDTLVEKHGKKVFDEEKKAVKDLEKVDETDVSGAIAALVAIDGELAQGAIDAAEEAFDAAGCNVTLTKDCEKAQQELERAAEEMAKAADELADGDFDKAIDKYKKAWEKADKALDDLS